MLSTFDVVLVDLQDLGCRIYTFVTTLRYMLEAAAKHGKEILGAGSSQPRRPPGRRAASEERLWKVFVGAGTLPMRHGMTLGELGLWFHPGPLKLDVEYRVVEMQGWQPEAAPGVRLAARASAPGSIPARTRPNLSMARAYAGTVMLEGTTLSEGPRDDAAARTVRRARYRRAARDCRDARARAPEWLAGCRLRECWFEPTVPQACPPALQRRADPTPKTRATITRRSSPGASRRLRSRRSAASIRDYPLWRDFAYEYEHGKLAIDVINGGPLLREWVDDANAMPADLDALTPAGRAVRG